MRWYESANMSPITGFVATDPIRPHAISYSERARVSVVSRCIARERQPSRVLFGFARTFPADQIDPVRCNELAFMDLFQLSLHDGRFMLIPRKAFSDTTPFAAIDTLIAKSTPIRSRGEEP